MLLSACNTAMGDENAELGFAGVAYQSQITSVLGSLWRVDDVATAVLMTAFHQTLAHNNPPSEHGLPNHVDNQDVMIKAEVLRTVQRALLNNDNNDINIEQRYNSYYLNLNLGESESILIPKELYDVGLDLNQLIQDLQHPMHWSSFVVVGNPW